MSDSLFLPYTEMSHMILFIVSATFMVLGMAIISIGMICRLCRVHRFHSNEFYKPIQDGSRSVAILTYNNWLALKYIYSSIQELETS